MIEKEEKETLIKASDVMRKVAYRHYDTYKQNSDSSSRVVAARASDAYEKFRELNKIADELMIVATSNGIK